MNARIGKEISNGDPVLNSNGKRLLDFRDDSKKSSFIEHEGYILFGVSAIVCCSQYLCTIYRILNFYCIILKAILLG